MYRSREQCGLTLWGVRCADCCGVWGVGRESGHGGQVSRKREQREWQRQLACSRCFMGDTLVSPRSPTVPRRRPTSKGGPRSLTHGAPDTHTEPSRWPRPRVRPTAQAFTRQSEAHGVPRARHLGPRVEGDSRAQGRPIRRAPCAAAAGRGIDREAEPKAARRGMAARQRIRLPIATPSVRMPTPSAAARTH